MGTSNRWVRFFYDMFWVLFAVAIMIDSQPSAWSYLFGIFGGILLHDALEKLYAAKPLPPVDS